MKGKHFLKYCLVFVAGALIASSITYYWLINQFVENYRYLSVSERTSIIDTNVSVLKLDDQLLRCRLANLTVFEARRLEKEMQDAPGFFASKAAHNELGAWLENNLVYMKDNNIESMSKGCEDIEYDCSEVKNNLDALMCGQKLNKSIQPTANASAD